MKDLNSNTFKLNFTEKENIGLLKKIRGSMNAGGTVAIWDVKQVDSGRQPDLIADGLGLFFLISSNGKCYTGKDYKRWLIEAGFKDVKVFKNLGGVHLLVCARG